MLSAGELVKLKVGDAISNGTTIFEHLSEEDVQFTVTRVVPKSKLVEFEVNYFDVKIGEWIAKVNMDGSVLWLDQAKTRTVQ